MPQHHSNSVKAYWLTFASLLVLTAATVGVAAIPLGRWHTPLALAIAAGKATLVILVFMHTLRAPRLTWIIIGGAIFWFGILITLTLADHLTRT
jgi:cytochrome c oxidase subunit IV